MIRPESVGSVRRGEIGAFFLHRMNSRSDRRPIREEQDWLQPQMENIYYHKRPAIQEYNVSANKNMLTIGTRRRQCVQDPAAHHVVRKRFASASRPRWAG